MAQTAKRWFHGTFRWYGGTRVGAWVNRRLLPDLDQWTMRRSGGKYSMTSIMTGLPVVRVTTIGAKSGKPRTLPLLAIPNGDGYLLIASNFGQPRHPAWYHNLRANPHAVVGDHRPSGGRERRYRVREAVGEDRAVLWQRAVDLYPGYESYARQTTRTIPVMVLEPES